MKWIGYFLFIPFFLSIFSSTFWYFPTSIVDTSTVSQYKKILGNFNKDLIERKIGLEGIVRYRFPSDFKTPGGEYALKKVSFKPLDDFLVPWKGYDKPKDWGFVTEDTEDFNITIKIPVPNYPKLEGKTIDGNIEIDVIYPEITKKARGPIPGKYYLGVKKLVKPLSIHIFTSDQLDLLSDLSKRMWYVQICSIALFFLLAMAILIFSYGLEEQYAVTLVLIFFLSLAFSIATSVYVVSLIVPGWQTALFKILLAIFLFFLFGLLCLVISFLALARLIGKIFKVDLFHLK